jgi:hypothetical protein
MSPSEPTIPAVDEVRELNRLFLAFLHERPDAASERFGLSPLAAGLLQQATPVQMKRAAGFPRALFRFLLPAPPPAGIMTALPRSSGERVLELVLLHGARNLSRMSGYAARLLLRLDGDAVNRLRGADVGELIAMSRADQVVMAAFDGLDWIWRELLTEARPEYRRRLLLIGFQPEFSLRPAAVMA